MDEAILKRLIQKWREKDNDQIYSDSSEDTHKRAVESAQTQTKLACANELEELIKILGNTSGK